MAAASPTSISMQLMNGDVRVLEVMPDTTIREMKERMKAGMWVSANGRRMIGGTGTRVVGSGVLHHDPPSVHLDCLTLNEWTSKWLCIGIRRPSKHWLLVPLGILGHLSFSCSSNMFHCSK